MTGKVKINSYKPLHRKAGVGRLERDRKGHIL